MISGLSFDAIQKERDEVLKTDQAAIRALAPYTAAVMGQGIRCVVGGEEKVEEEKELFKNIKELS